MPNPYYEKFRAKIEGALIDNGGLDIDLLTHYPEDQVADFIMKHYLWPEFERFIHAIDELHSCWVKPAGDDYEDIDEEARKTILDVHTALHHQEMHGDYEF